jgi:hypothetical protein
LAKEELMIAKKIFPIAALLFGVLTLAEGASRISSLDSAAMQAQGIIPAILYFNTISALLYLAAGTAALWHKKLAFQLALALSLTLLAMSGYLTFYIAGGGAFLTKTIGAMALRLTFWIGFTIWSRRLV